MTFGSCVRIKEFMATKVVPSNPEPQKIETVEPKEEVPALSVREEPPTLSVRHAYARGVVNFMGIELLVAPGALVPRPETELLGRMASKLIEVRRLMQPRIIDMCCGSGNLACALACRIADARVWASDLTDECVAVAFENVRRLGLYNRVHVAQGDLFAGLKDQEIEASIDLIVCNPPYISQKRLSSDRATLLEREPREAFDGGPYGLSIHQRVIRECLSFLKPRGLLLFEIGLGQERQVTMLFERSRAFGELRFVNNIAGIPRVVYAQRK